MWGRSWQTRSNSPFRASPESPTLKSELAHVIGDDERTLRVFGCFGHPQGREVLDGLISFIRESDFAIT
jgi:hypothetical protein